MNKCTADNLDKDLSQYPVFHFAVAYEGTRYAGWQIQPETSTIQHEIEWRLNNLYGTDFAIHGTSRTDAGVHALDQHFSFIPPFRQRYTPDKLKFLLNRWLPKDIRIHTAKTESSNFHARKSAQAKSYVYAVRDCENYNPFENRYVWSVRHRLNCRRMQQAADMLKGKHDFAMFAANRGIEDYSTERHIHRLEIKQQSGHTYIVVIGASFLYKMVRSLVGYLVLQPGRLGKWTPEALEKILNSSGRPPTVQTAPAHGLFLDKVFFAEGALWNHTPTLPPYTVNFTSK